MKIDNSKKGFTLAEVLITLGIIGVVAALTMPSLIANYQKKVISARLKKFVSSFSQAYNMAVVNYGDPAYWEHCGDLVTLRNCETPSGSSSQKILTYLNAVENTNSIPDTYIQAITVSGKSISSNFSSDLKKTKYYQLRDGTLLFGMHDVGSSSSLGTSLYITFTVDVNGLSKPNRYGKDIFLFVLFLTKHIVYDKPGVGVQMNLHGGASVFYDSEIDRGLYMNGYGYLRNKSLGYIKTSCSQGAIILKFYCASSIQENGWEIPDYYHWNAF